MDLLNFAEKVGWKDYFEGMDFFKPVPDIGQGSVNVLRFEFKLSLSHLAAVKYLHWKCLEMSNGFCGTVAELQDFLTCQIENELRIKLPIESSSRIKLREMYKSFIKSIGGWIMYTDRYIFNSKLSECSVAVDLMRCIVLNVRGSIDYTRTAEQLLFQPIFNNQHKLEIACTHCLENEIRILERRFGFPSNLPNTYSKTAELVMFWKRYLTGDDSGGGIEHIFDIVCPRNLSVLQFVLDRWEDRTYGFVSVIYNGDADVQCFFMNYLTRDEQLSVLKRCGGNFLKNLMDDFIWSEYLLEVVLFARNVITNNQYYDVLAYAANRIVPYHLDDKYLTVFHFLWNHAPKRVKNYFFKKCDVQILSWIRDIFDYEFLITVMSEATPEFRNQYINSRNGRIVCFQMLIEDDIDDFANLTMIVWQNSGQREEFVYNLLLEDEMGKFIDEKVAEESKNHLSKIFNRILSPEKVQQFKKQYLFRFKNCFFVNMFMELTVFTEVFGGCVRESADFTMIDDAFRWFLNKKDEIETFKREKLRLSDAFNTVVAKLLILTKYDLIDELFQWCVGDGAEIY